MKIRLTKLTKSIHHFEVTRADGTTDGKDLETRSFLLHDLIHYAVEAELPIVDGFWGSLAAGSSLASLQEAVTKGGMSDGQKNAELLVAPLQSLWNSRLDKDQYLAIVSRVPGADACFVERALTRLRGLWGHWRATRFGSAMDLHWPPDGGRRL